MKNNNSSQFKFISKFEFILKFIFGFSIIYLSGTVLFIHKRNIPQNKVINFYKKPRPIESKNISNKLNDLETDNTNIFNSLNNKLEYVKKWYIRGKYKKYGPFLVDKFLIFINEKNKLFLRDTEDKYE